MIIKLDENKNIKVGSLGKVNFRRGYYLYVGSALNGLEKRIRRHLSKNKKIHWHIDYLLMEGDVVDVYIKIGNTKEECEIARRFSEKYPSIEGFGSSDCKCGSHLFFSDDKEDLIGMAKSLGMFAFR